MSEEKEPLAYLGKEEIKRLLEPLKPVFKRAQQGNFSKDPEIAEGMGEGYADGAFTDLYEGMRAMLDAVREIIEELGDANIQLEAKAKELSERQHELVEAKDAFEREAKTDTAILASIGEGLVVTSREERILLINDAALSALGFRRDDCIGQRIGDILVLEREDGTAVKHDERPFARATKENKTVTAGISDGFYYAKKGTGRIPVSITATPIPHGNLGVVSVFRDITREKEIDREKSEFISIASHQLRTPLSSIGWHAEMLSAGEVGSLTPKQVEYLIKINRAKRRMAAIVRNLLDVTRMELGTLELRPSAIDVREEAQIVIDELEPISHNENVSVALSVEKDFPMLRTDRNAVRAILQNLIMNAVKYTPEGGEVRVSAKTEENDGYVTLEVTDTGVGIPKEEQDKIFTKFFRASNVKEFDTSGTGLGLYAVRQFVEAMGGEITFTSAVGKGTTFRVVIPSEIGRTAGPVGV